MTKGLHTLRGTSMEGDGMMARWKTISEYKQGVNPISILVPGNAPQPTQLVDVGMIARRHWLYM